jgi:hypothetical protein
VIPARSFPAVFALQLCLSGVSQFVYDEILEAGEKAFRFVLLQDEHSGLKVDDMAVAGNEGAFAWFVVVAGMPVVWVELDRREDDADIERIERDREQDCSPAQNHLGALTPSDTEHQLMCIEHLFRSPERLHCAVVVDAPDLPAACHGCHDEVTRPGEVEQAIGVEVAGDVAAGRWIPVDTPSTTYASCPPRRLSATAARGRHSATADPVGRPELIVKPVRVVPSDTICRIFSVTYRGCCRRLGTTPLLPLGILSTVCRRHLASATIGRP